MQQMKAWYLETCGEKLALRRSDRFWSLQLMRRGMKRLKVRVYLRAWGSVNYCVLIPAPF